MPVRVYFGSENYLDKVTLTPAEFYARFAVTDAGAEDVAAAARRLHAGLPERRDPRGLDRLDPPLRRPSPGPTRRRSSARGPVEKTRLEHVDSRNVSVGLGLVVRAAAEAAAAGRSADEVAQIARDAAARVRLFIAVPTLEHLVRGGRVSPLKGLLAKLLGLLPVLTLSEDGTARAGGEGPRVSPPRAGR